MTRPKWERGERGKRNLLLLLPSMGLQFSVTLMIGFVRQSPQEGRRGRKKVDFLSWTCLPLLWRPPDRRLNARHSGRKHSGDRESSGKRHTFGLGSLVGGFTVRLATSSSIDRRFLGSAYFTFKISMSYRECSSNLEVATNLPSRTPQRRA